MHARSADVILKVQFMHVIFRSSKSAWRLLPQLPALRLIAGAPTPNDRRLLRRPRNSPEAGWLSPSLRPVGCGGGVLWCLLRLVGAVAMSHSIHTSWLAQFESDDRDFRFMATSDLLNELKKPTFSADESMQKRVCPDPSCLRCAVFAG